MSGRVSPVNPRPLDYGIIGSTSPRCITDQAYLTADDRKEKHR